MDNPPDKFLGAEGTGSLHRLLHGVEADDELAPEIPVEGNLLGAASLSDTSLKSVDPAALARAKQSLATDPPPDIPEKLDGGKVLPKRRPKANLGDDGLPLHP